MFWLFKCNLLVCMVLCVPSVADGRRPLYIGGLFPLSEKDGWSRFFGFGGLKGVERAIHDINNRTDVLPGYELIMIYNDTEVRTIHF